MPKRKKPESDSPVKKHKSEESDSSADSIPTRRFTIEHCKSWSVYKRHAVRISALLTAQYPDIPVLLNPSKPRSKSFEVVFVDEEKETVVWSGHKIPPPRKNKFPADDRVGELLEEMMPDLL